MDLLRQLLDFDVVWDSRNVLLSGLLTTLKLTIVTFSLSLVPGLVIAIGRLYGPRVVRTPLFLVVSFIRSVPAVVGIVFVFFALPFVGVTLGSFASVVLMLTLIQSVYFSEVFRGGLLSVGKGQFEAAYACGLKAPSVYRRVVLPQAFAVAAPAFTSSIVQLVQNTTVSSVIALEDLLGASLNVQFITASPAALFPAALLYLAFLLPLVRIVRRREEKMAEARAHG